MAIDRIGYGGNGDWNVDTDWNPGGVPEAADTAIINGSTVTVDVEVNIAGLVFFRRNA